MRLTRDTAGPTQWPSSHNWLTNVWDCMLYRIQTSDFATDTNLVNGFHIARHLNSFVNRNIVKRWLRRAARKWRRFKIQLTTKPVVIEAANVIDRSCREARDTRLTIVTSGIVPTTSALPENNSIAEWMKRTEWMKTTTKKNTHKSVTVKIVCMKRAELTVLVAEMLLDFNGVATMNAAHNTISPNDLEKIVIWERERWWRGKAKKKKKMQKKKKLNEMEICIYEFFVQLVNAVQVSLGTHVWARAATCDINVNWTRHMREFNGAHRNDLLEAQPSCTHNGQCIESQFGPLFLEHTSHSLDGYWIFNVRLVHWHSYPPLWVARSKKEVEKSDGIM